MRKRSTLFQALEESRQLYGNTEQPINPDEYCFIGIRVMRRQKKCFEEQGILDPDEMHNAIKTLEIAAAEYDKLGQSVKAIDLRRQIEEAIECLDNYMTKKMGGNRASLIPRPPAPSR